MGSNIYEYVISNEERPYLVFGEPSTNGPGLLGAQIKRQKLLLLVSFPKSSLLLLGNHCQYLSDRQPHYLTAVKNNQNKPNKHHSKNPKAKQSKYIYKQKK